MARSYRIEAGIACLVAAFCLTSAVNTLRVEHEQYLLAAKANPVEHFNLWLTKHAKKYTKDVEETAKRFAIWRENLDYILNYNAQHTTHWLGLNSLADLSSEEYRQKYLGYDHAARKTVKRPLSSFRYADVSEEALPPAVDWKAAGAVTPVKNQEQCGSCWAFSTTGSVEGINAIVTKKLVSLSEQELVDCDKEQDNGCSGGLMDFAYQFIMKNGGLDTEDDYPYTAADGVCMEGKKNRHVVTIDSYEDVPENDEVSLKKAVAHQPVSVAIEADQKAFQLYMGGVFSDESCGTSLDHGVLVTGYGKDPKGGAFWTIKNSWGGEWGEAGYIRIKAGVKAKEGLCGVAMAASYPVKTTPNPEPGPPGPEPGPKPKPGPGPAPDEPVACDEETSCPPSTTCCCVDEFLGMCLDWGCCPIPEATCCEDRLHCCPSDLPVCDTVAARCLPKKGSIEGSIPWLAKLPSKRKPSIFDRIFKRGHAQQ